MRRQAFGRNRWLRALVVVWPLIVAVPCDAQPQAGRAAPASPPDSVKPPAGLSGLSGTVGRSPVRPISSIGGKKASTAPVVGVKVILSQLRGRGGEQTEVKSTTTDSAGRYRLFVPPGTYVVTLGPLTGHVSARDLPATVTLIKGETKTLDITLDTGIR